MDRPVIDGGAVAVTGERIVRVGGFAEVCAARADEITDLGDVVLLPGLINAHCHLDFTSLRGQIPPQRSFANWIRSINAKRRELSDDDFLAAIAEGFAEARKWGTTTIANIESLPHLLARMEDPPLRAWWFLELIDVRTDAPPEELVEKALSLGKITDGWPGGFGLSPHAPYTASPRLSQLAATNSTLRLTMHLAESREEMDMFRDGRGSLFDLLQSLGRPMDDCGQGRTPLATMLARQPLDERWIIVHLNELTEEDFALLARGPRFHIAHCPRSGRYFAHSPFALARLRALGFNICLGTDSLASNSSLNLFSEMRAVRAANPAMRAQDILEMATSNGARALNCAASLGQVAPGFAADLIALPFTGRAEDVFEHIINWREPIVWHLAGGILRTL
ncbi:MAG: amidohydrolase family protein [Chthoniobacterales bacterium]|nr:amidohydrolase family protein [Chthoniobacterales bacterium]